MAAMCSPWWPIRDLAEATRHLIHLIPVAGSFYPRQHAVARRIS
jgi:hypothetical protein